MTGWGCNTAPILVTLNPATNLMRPGDFSRALASLGNKPQSVTTISNAVAQGVSNNDVNPGSSTTAMTTPFNSRPQSTPQSTPQSSSAANSSGGLSESNKIGLGVGIGVGLPATVATIVMCWRDIRKRR